MRNAFFAATAALTLAAAPAWAQQADQPVPTLSTGDLPSPGTAQLISLGATVGVAAASVLAYKAGQEGLSSGLTVAAAMLGPTAGYIYGGRTGRGLTGTGLRLGALALGVTASSDCGFGRGDCGAAFVSGAVILASGIVDLVMVDNAVRDRNTRLAGRVGVAPYVEPSGGVGAMLTLRH